MGEKKYTSSLLFDLFSIGDFFLFFRVILLLLLSKVILLFYPSPHGEVDPGLLILSCFWYPVLAPLLGESHHDQQTPVRQGVFPLSLGIQFPVRSDDLGEVEFPGPTQGQGCNDGFLPPKGIVVRVGANVIRTVIVLVAQNAVEP